MIRRKMAATNILSNILPYPIVFLLSSECNDGGGWDP